jgi:hypothetical protein
MPSQVTDTLVESLLADERLLTRAERELLASLLCRANTSSLPGSDCAAQVQSLIARCIGETLLQRAPLVLGELVAKKLLDQAATYSLSQAPKTPKPTPPPSPTPAFDSPKPNPTPPPSISSHLADTRPLIEAGGRPRPAGPKPVAPPPPSMNLNGSAHTMASQPGAASAALIDRPPRREPRVIVLDEFLAPRELQALTQYALRSEPDFALGEVISPGVAPGATESAVDFQSRRSRVLMQLGPHYQVFSQRLQACLPQVLERLQHDAFAITRIEAQITASNHGDFFSRHFDDGEGELATRELTFVYFFHREPRKFSGGELRVYDSKLDNGELGIGEPLSAGPARIVIPGQNQIVFFPSNLLHEISPVECPSGAFADSRFTVNGWLHR